MRKSAPGQEREREMFICGTDEMNHFVSGDEVDNMAHFCFQKLLGTSQQPQTGMLQTCKRLGMRMNEKMCLHFEDSVVGRGVEVSIGVSGRDTEAVSAVESKCVVEGECAVKWM